MPKRKNGGSGSNTIMYILFALFLLFGASEGWFDNLNFNISPPPEDGDGDGVPPANDTVPPDDDPADDDPVPGEFDGYCSTLCIGIGYVNGEESTNPDEMDNECGVDQYVASDHTATCCCWYPDGNLDYWGYPSCSAWASAWAMDHSAVSPPDTSNFDACELYAEADCESRDELLIISEQNDPDCCIWACAIM